MIDPHNHLLPAIDDGARSFDVSISMLAQFQQLGYTTIVTTPHVTDLPAPDYAARVAEAFDRVAPEAAALGLTLLSGYEVLLTPRTAQLAADGAKFTLGSSKTILVEVSMAGWPAFTEQVLFDLQVAGFSPILAHPERYPSVVRDPGLAIGLAERGIALQATTSAFTGLFGREVQRTAEELLLAGAINVLGSDAHGLGRRVEALVPGIERVEELIGADRTQQLLADNLHALLNDLPLPEPAAIEAAPRRRRGLLSRIR